MKVLLAEDNPDHRFLLERIVRGGEPDANVVSVDSGAAFLDRLAREQFDVALLDYHLPDYDGTELLRHADLIPNCPPIIVISADRGSDTIITTLRSGGRDFLPKDEAFDARHLLGRMREALKRRRNEVRLIEDQKDECLAVLAGGIAHDFNNMLVGILGKAALMAENAPANTKEREYCDGIQRTAHRLADLAKQLLAYARGGKYQPKQMDPNEAVRDTMAMLKGVIKAGIDVNSFLRADIWPVFADQSQVVQALLNLCLNAAEAMGDHGTLSLFTENVHKPTAWSCRLSDYQPPGDYVHIVIADTGGGIPSEVSSRMFEPYYSTKGHGRGLGLAAVQGIVRNHSGALTLATEPGDGTAFHLYFPRMRSGNLMRSIPCVGDNDHSTVQRILIVEDDEEVREVAVDILDARHHQITCAIDGRTAIERIENAEQSYDVIVLDMRLPDMSGADVFARCKQAQPDARVVVCSGYDRDVVLSSLLRHEENVCFLPKPFTPNELIEAVELAASAQFSAAATRKPAATPTNGNTQSSGA